MPAAPFRLAILVVALPTMASAQWVSTSETFYLPAAHNWTFRRTYPVPDRLFNAFDYGHAVLYERLWSSPGGPVAELEEKEFGFITKSLLVNPPRLPLAESAIAPTYGRLAPEAQTMFHWAHLLHRQTYDVIADDRLSDSAKDAEVRTLLTYYQSRPDLAFSDVPKSMELMTGQPYSRAFLNRYPKFNGLIWAYHWLQIGLYEALLIGRTPTERQAAVARTVDRFREMVAGAPGTLPTEMPMAPTVAPTFVRRFPEAAAVFDNLHAMHDVISDVLANPAVPRQAKRAEILRAAARYRDGTTSIVTRDAWWEMAESMGVAAQGGRVR